MGVRLRSPRRDDDRGRRGRRAARRLSHAPAPTQEAAAELLGLPFSTYRGHLTTGQRPILAGRPFIEGHVRRRVRALPAIDVRDRLDVVGLAATPDGARVTGVRVLGRADGSADETLPADLVVAATGRAARVPGWLEAMGHPRPAEQRVFDDSGHWPFVDAPAAVEAALLGHLARHAPLAAPAGVVAA